MGRSSSSGSGSAEYGSAGFEGVVDLEAVVDFDFVDFLCLAVALAPVFSLSWAAEVEPREEEVKAEEDEETSCFLVTPPPCTVPLRALPWPPTLTGEMESAGLSFSSLSCGV